MKTESALINNTCSPFWN